MTVIPIDYLKSIQQLQSSQGIATAPAISNQPASIFSGQGGNNIYSQTDGLMNITKGLLAMTSSLASMPTMASSGATNPFGAMPSSGMPTATAGNMPMQSTSNDARSKKYESMLGNMQLNLTESQKSELNKFKQIFEQNKDKYENVARKLGVPEQLIPMVSKAIWAIHCREGSCDFTTYLHNGEKLGKPTTLVPAGINFSNWEDAAVDAIKRELPKVGGKMPQSVPEWCAFAELYNGLGYENKGVVSPYVMSGTSHYTGGKYVADGRYDPNHKDQQLGFAALMMG